MGKEIIKVDVIFLMRESCFECKEVLRILSIYMKDKNYINFTIIDLDDENNFKRKHSSITPSIWVNDRMWSAGKVNIERFDEKINKLVNIQ
ncbi:MAG: thioredoxin family protein [Candidatus Marinimicrobia bacterium]|nr:thioredoxin family protein [Candidatus Neomarinimicrobiota bacterium]